MNKQLIITAAVLAAISVGLGAFGAHTLKNSVSIANLQIFETGVRYQFYHVLGLLAIGILWQQFAGKLLQWASRLFIVGIILFSGSLYALTLLPENYRWVGAITPLGGGCYIAGWICTALAVWKQKA